MSKVNKLVTVSANIATVLLCLVFGAQFLLARMGGQPNPPRATYQPGETISVPGIDFQVSQMSIVLVVRKDCRFCHASMPFYQRLSRAAGPKGIRTIVLTSDDLDVSRRYFEASNIPVDEFVQKKGADAKLGETPIVLIVDSTGTVKGTFVGLQDVPAEDTIVRQITEGAFGG